jgi:hypothetical protein
MAALDESRTGTQSAESTPAVRPLTRWSDDEVIAAYDQESQDTPPGALMLQVEVSRRASARASEASDKLARSLSWLTILLLVLTCALVVLGVMQFIATLRTSNATATSPGPAEAPAFELVGAPWFYCPPHAIAKEGPCTVGAIFRSTGGPGTELVTFTSPLPATQSCQAIIPSTPTGSDAQAVCVVPSYIKPNSHPIWAISP